MNGGQDLGGIQGLEAIAPERDEPVFHAGWERRAFAITLAAGLHGRWSIDQARYAREDRHPAEYLRASYYELWQLGLERLAVESGLVGADELAAGHALRPGEARAVAPAEAAKRLERGGSTERELAAAPRFAIGDRVRVRDTLTAGHTRAPRYCRGRVGRVHAQHGGHVFPDSSAAGAGENPQPLYAVRFAARDLWGAGAGPKDSVFVDLWEPYLEPAA